MEVNVQSFNYSNFDFSIREDNTWLLIHPITGIELSSSYPKIIIEQNGKKRELLPSYDQARISQKSEFLQMHGSAANILTCVNQIDGLNITTEFAFLGSSPLFLMRLHIQNHSADTIELNSITLVESSPSNPSIFRTTRPDYACYVNGWQSWSYSGTYSSNQKQKISRLNFLERPMWNNASTPVIRKRGKFSSDFFSVIIDRSTRQGLLVGFLSQKQQFGHAVVDLIPEPRIKLVANCDGVRILTAQSISTDWAVIQIVDFEDSDPLGPYIEASAKDNHAHVNPNIPVGWCSWYEYYTHISPKNLLSNIKLISDLKADIPLDLIQIDDGFEKAVGDWLDFKPEFLEGLEPLTQAIRSAGYTPGVWLAPFIVHPSSMVYRNHQEMILKKENGKFVKSGWNWNNFTTSLDMSHPAAREYIYKVIDTAVNTWGFPYLKLDFLYAAAIPGKHYDQTLTRAQIYDSAMCLVRDAAGKDTYILGCGAPIGAMIGHVDAMRIGADVASDWKPKYKGVELLLPDEPNIPSVENALQNTLTRAWYHKRWWINDPDCLLVRTTTNLTQSEIQTQASLTAMSGGLVLLSDDLSQIPPERMNIIRSLIPIIGKTPMVLDWQDRLTPSMTRVDMDGPIGVWHLVSYTNWSDQPCQPNICLKSFNLDPNLDWIVSSFWTKKVTKSDSGKFVIDPLPAHATWMAAIREDRLEHPIYVGSSLHISQGMEVDDWIDNGKQIRVVFHLPRNVSGEVFLKFPRQEIQLIEENGKSSRLTSTDQIFRHPVNFSKFLKITINY